MFELFIQLGYIHNFVKETENNPSAANRNAFTRKFYAFSGALIEMSSTPTAFCILFAHAYLSIQPFIFLAPSHEWTFFLRIVALVKYVNWVIRNRENVRQATHQISILMDNFRLYPTHPQNPWNYCLFSKLVFFLFQIDIWYLRRIGCLI